ncbi:MAG: hypothetical protein QME92_07395 [Bacillota bacterium]|nr:hypothetical protein [Bacillota bacterium]
MSLREELLKAIDAMTEEDLEELLEFARWLRADKEELTPDEKRELEEARAEVARGEVVSWREIRRSKVQG